MAETKRSPRTGILARTWADIAVLTVLSAIGLLGFAASFGDLAYLLAGFGGLLVGTGAALLAAYLRLDIILTVLVVVAAYFLFGSAFAMPAQALFGVLPTVDTLSGLAIGAVFGWADIVTLTTPVVAPDYIGVLPYIVTWAVGIVSATLAARWFVAKPRTAPRSFLALLGPIAIYVTGVLTGTDEPYLAAVRGVPFAIIALVWMSWRTATQTGTATTGVLRRKLLGVGAIVLAAVVVGGTLGFVSAPSQDSRFVLRDEIEPPFDPLLYASPLSGFRKYTKDLEDTPLFSVGGLEAGDRIRLATMDSYDGKLWNVTGPDLYADGSGSFSLVGSETTPTGLITPSGTRTLDVTVEGYSDVWLPGIGYPTIIAFDEDAGLDSTALRYNGATGIAVVIGGLKNGMHYDVTAELQDPDSDLADVPVATIDLPPVSNVPDIVAAKATELAGDAGTPIEQLRAIESALFTQGYLSHGSASDQRESSAGHGANRMKLLLERSQWIGDEEQYASVFALMARGLGYPARVVMGFAPEASGGAPVVVTGSDVTAWVEVAFEGVGWIPFYPTPDEKPIPEEDTPQPQSEPQPQVRQPPITESDQDDLVSAVELEDPEEDKAEPFTIPGWVWTVTAIVGIPAALYFIPLIIVALVKRRRRARRRAAAEADRRAAGAWDELVDTYAELGYAASRRATRLQLALDFERQFREEVAAREGDAGDGTSSVPVLTGLREFAVDTDRAVFSGVPVPDQNVDQLWSESDLAREAARRSVSWLRRQLSKFRIRQNNDLAETLAKRIAAQKTRGATSR